jgi:two-component system LytT family sensor kinase
MYDMLKRFNLKIGIPFALLCSAFAILLSFIRIESNNNQQFFILSYYYFTFSLLAWVGNHYLVEFIYEKKSIYNASLFYVYSIVAGCICSLIFDVINTLITGKMLPVYQIKLTDDYKRMVLIALRGTLTNGLNAFLVFNLKQIKIRERGLLELEHLKQAKLQASLSSLKEQLSPHFLFNTFSTLSSLSKEQNVKDFVEEMANVYRYLLDYQKNDVATLQQELNFTESYLYIMKIRMEDAIKINIDVNEELLLHAIPPLTIQLLIENAIKHNITSAAKPLAINIYTKGLELIVSNKLQPRMSVKPSSGIGLNNVAQRYQLLFKKEIMIETNHEMFIVTLPL